MNKYIGFILILTFILTPFSFPKETQAAGIWTEQTGSGSRAWKGITSSSDGTKLAAVDSASGYVYISTDEGVTWATSTNSGTGAWELIEGSSDLSILMAGRLTTLRYSSNSGVDWSSIQPTSKAWYGIGMSDNGQTVLLGGQNSYLYTSINSGTNWTSLEENPPFGTYYDSFVSPDGTKMATAKYGGYVYTSSDSGANWTERTGSGSRKWFSIAGSSDGTKLVAAVYNGYIYTSTDSGATWATSTDAGSRTWRKVVSSSDGTKLAGVVQNGYIYISTDSGATWTAQTSAGSRSWYSITSSSDGTKLAATVNSGYIYTYEEVPVTAPSVTTNSASSVASSSAVLNAEITDNGGEDVSQSGFAYGTSSDLSTTIATSTLGTQSGNTEFEEEISDLSPKTTYYFRAYVTNSTSTAYGDIESFTTLAALPYVTTGSATDTTTNSATISGEITDTGGEDASTVGVVYGETTSYGNDKSQSGSYSDGTFSLTITDLSCNTTYHYKTYATNSAGTSYGSDHTFSTDACPKEGGSPRRTVSNESTQNISKEQKVTSVLSSLSSIVQNINQSPITEQEKQALLQVINLILQRLMEVI